MPRTVDHPTRDDIDLIAGEFWGRDPHEEMAWMRANAPVYWDGRVWGITRYDDLREIAKSPDRFSNAGGIRPDQAALPMMIERASVLSSRCMNSIPETMRTIPAATMSGMMVGFGIGMPSSLAVL